MKITVDIDCTPEEARTFLGLPEVKSMQDAMMREIEETMKKNLAVMEPEAMFKIWMPAGIQGLEQLQKMFWSQMTQGATVTSGKSSDK